MSGRRIGAVLLALVAVTSRAASGHDTWLLAPSATAPTGGRVALELTSGGEFAAPDHAVEPDRIASAQQRTGSATAPLRVGKRGDKALAIEADGARAGVAALWVSLHPKTLELEPELIAEYLAEIGAADTIGAKWAARPQPKTWRETYRKHAKTFVKFGSSPADTSWEAPVGLALEIVPLVDPTRLKPGDTLAVRVLKDGAPLAGFPLRAAPSGAHPGTFQKTDETGGAAFVLDKPGAWLLAATELRESASGNGDWESDFTTLTVRVGPPGTASK
jgi:uncharacterized GH25 family protein